MQDIAVIVHDPRHQLSHGLAEELSAVGASPYECSAFAYEVAHKQFQAKLLPRRDEVRRSQRLTCSLEVSKIRLIREVQQGQFWLVHVRAFKVLFLLTGFLDSEPSVRPAVLVVSLLPPAAVFLSSSPDDRIDGA